MEAMEGPEQGNNRSSNAKNAQEGDLRVDEEFTRSEDGEQDGGGREGRGGQDDAGDDADDVGCVF
jgi:hypothetical protein